MPRKALVNDNDTGSRFVVAIVKSAAPDHRNAHWLEVAGSHRNAQRGNEGLTRLHLIAFGKNHAVIVVVAKGNRLRGACEGNSRDDANGGERPIHKVTRSLR